MQIQCTKKLLNELKITATPSQADDPLFGWHANILIVNRRKTLVLVNDSNRYIIVLHGLKAKDFKKIDTVIIQAIRETFQEENIKNEVIDAYISQINEISYTSTKNRTLVARMNKACENVYFWDRDLDLESLNQIFVSKNLSRLLVGIGKKDYTNPNEDLYKDLEKFTGGPIFNSDAVILHVRLELHDVDVWRKVAVPKHISFPDLHRTLQILFNWQDSHLHQFNIYAAKPTSLERKKQRENRKPIVKLVSHEEAFVYDSGIPMKMETREKLSDYLPAEITYNYDFGDDWNHHIVVENMIDDYDLNYPICLAGEGDAPPEDVGGEPGFEAFLSIITDPDHPDYNHMRSWGISQGYKQFDLDMVNRQLKSM